MDTDENIEENKDINFTLSYIHFHPKPVSTPIYFL